MSSESWGPCPGCGAERSRENASKLPDGRVVHVGCPMRGDHPSSMAGDQPPPPARPRRVVGLGRKGPAGAPAQPEPPPAPSPPAEPSEAPPKPGGGGVLEPAICEVCGGGSAGVKGMVIGFADVMAHLACARSAKLTLRGGNKDRIRQMRTELPRYPGDNEMSLQTCASLGIGLATREEAESQSRPADEVVEPPPLPALCEGCSFPATDGLGPLFSLPYGPRRILIHRLCARKRKLAFDEAEGIEIVRAFVGLLVRIEEWEQAPEPEIEDEDDEERARRKLDERQRAALKEPPPPHAYNRPPAPHVLEPGRVIHVFESRQGPLWADAGPLTARCGLQTRCGGRDLEWTILASSFPSSGKVEEERICLKCGGISGGNTPYPAFVSPSQILTRPGDDPPVAPPRIAVGSSGNPHRSRRLR